MPNSFLCVFYAICLWDLDYLHIESRFIRHNIQTRILLASGTVLDWFNTGFAALAARESESGMCLVCADQGNYLQAAYITKDKFDFFFSAVP